MVGSWVVLSMPTYRELWQVEQVTELSRAEFATSGTVTRLTLAGGENYAFFRDAVRETTVFAVSEPLDLTDGPDISPVSGREIEVGIDVSDLKAGRSLIVRGTSSAGVDHSEVVEVVSVRSIGGRWVIGLVEDLSTAYDRSTVVVHANVALATHGETVTEILGSGAASEPFQRFELSHSPLTFVQSADPSGTDSTLEVRVNETEWDETPTLYGSGRADRQFVVRLDETGRRTVRFGDGTRGARLPTGSQNIRAKYRRGLGQEGNVGAGTISQLLDRPLGAKGVTNPAAASGGVDPEDEESARANMSLNVRTLGRAVSLLDYADFARAFTGVSKAHVAVLPLRGGRTVVVTVAFTPGTVSDTASRLNDLQNALGEFGDPQVKVEVIAHRDVTFRLALRVAIDPVREVEVVLNDIGETLRAAFTFVRRSLVEPLHRSDLVRVAHSVAGVDAVDIDRLYTEPPSISPTGSSSKHRPWAPGESHSPPNSCSLTKTHRLAGGDDMSTPQRMYSSVRALPAPARAVYRIRDERARQASVLRELVSLIARASSTALEEKHRAALRRSVHRDRGSLGGAVHRRSHRLSHPARSRSGGGVASSRGRHTIAYRRRKGTASMLEQLARDVTGWPARAVEFFELLVTTQFMNHVRPHAEATAGVTHPERLEIGGSANGGAFDGLSHIAEMRRVATRSGRYNIPNIGIFLWRVNAMGLWRSPLVDADGGGRRYRFDQLGADRQLFALPRTEPEITHIAEPFDVPLPMTRRWVSSHLAEYYGGGLSLLLEGERAAGFQDSTWATSASAISR